MTFPTPRLAIISAAIACAALCAPMAAAQGPAARSLTYALDWGPAALARLSITMRTDGDETILSGDGQSTGLLAWFSDFEITQTGRYGLDGPITVASEARFGEDRTARNLSFSPGAAPLAETLIAPPSDAEPRSPIPDGALIGAVDALFPILAAMRSLDAGGDCAGDHRVFTGRSAFRITLSDRGADTLVADRDWTFSGLARRCAITTERIGGFPLEGDGAEHDEAGITRDIWFATLPGGAAPVRMQIEWPLGYAIGRIDLR